MDPIDAISTRMLKHIASAIAPSVTNLSIRTGQLPKDWKVSHVASAHSKAAWGKVSLRLPARIPIVYTE